MFLFRFTEFLENGLEFFKIKRTLEMGGESMEIG